MECKRVCFVAHLAFDVEVCMQIPSAKKSWTMISHERKPVVAFCFPLQVIFFSLNFEAVLKFANFMNPIQ